MFVKFVLFGCVLMLRVWCSLGNQQFIKKSEDCPKILNGRVANQKQYPFQVSIQQQVNVDPDPHRIKICGGVILSENWVLTAAHCFAQFTSTNNLAINSGVLNALNYNGPSQFIPISGVFFPTNFNKTGNINDDLAMVKLLRPLRVHGAVQPITLAPGNYEPTGCGEIIGWGLTNGRNSTSEAQDLLSGTVTISDLSACVQFYKMSGNQICVGYNSAVNACNGDSGGPLIQYFEGKPKVVGITSFGTVGCPTGYPSVYTKVSAYLDWIQSVIQMYSTPEQFTKYRD